MLKRKPKMKFVVTVGFPNETPTVAVTPKGPEFHTFPNGHAVSREVLAGRIASHLLVYLRDRVGRPHRLPAPRPDLDPTRRSNG